MFINGQWVETGKTYDLINPGTGEILAKVADGGTQEVKLAIAAARDAFPKWAKISAKERGAILKKAEANMLARADEIAHLVMQENGKPLEEAKQEVLFSSGYLSWFAEEGRRAYGETIPSPFGHKRLMTLLQPVGVVGAITPWNFPANMITRKIAPALAAGCTVVLKPADTTPLTALAIAQALHDAGTPPGVFNIVTAKDPRPVSAEFLADPVVRMIGFTGSIGVGKMLMEQSAKQLKKLSLELGGNAPVLVFDDADLHQAVERVAAIKFMRVGGESCICANRIYVQEKIYKTFVAKFVEKVKSYKVGPGHKPGVQIGPLITQAARERVDQLVQQTKAQGGKILLGGHPLTEGDCAKGFFYAPTVIEGTQDDWPICQNEIFGPVANLLSFSTEEEVLQRAN
ncbi:MAG: NAD-dependent succinate-semialdehyde dehydrogenase, partial [Verrucomicrobia bacterium]|nr:NAD-dependent succinate-semialdehyde dehydrogenase [Verrucomicrobiota bacterium]